MKLTCEFLDLLCKGRIILVSFAAEKSLRALEDDVKPSHATVGH